MVINQLIMFIVNFKDGGFSHQSVETWECSKNSNGEITKYIPVGFAIVWSGVLVEILLITLYALHIIIILNPPK